MKICKIYLRDFEQFQNVDLDFTHPETGEPLDKICFIGSNGTGKSKILKVISWYLNIFNSSIDGFDTKIAIMHRPSHFGKILFEVIHNNFAYYVYSYDDNINIFRTKSKINPNQNIGNRILENFHNEDVSNPLWNELSLDLMDEDFINEFQFHHNSNDLVIYSPSESSQNGYKNIIDVPEVTLRESLETFKNFKYNSEVSAEHINTFWKLLNYNLHKRAEEKENFETQPKNLIRIKQDLINEFDGFYPKVLDKLGDVWNKILDKAGLYFDVKGANIVYQLDDNLRAYIKLKNTNEIVPYGELSTGIRNYIFRLGHIFSLYNNREIDRGFLLVDEPENSLFPDFLFDLMDTYKNVIIDKRGQNNTQVFFATHNPIVAAQFQSYERIILEWKEDGSVSASSGVAPEGDDPNDLLKKDFGIRELMGSAGLEKWEYYRNLKRKLKQTEEIEEKMNIASEINKLGQLYNFPA